VQGANAGKRTGVNETAEEKDSEQARPMFEVGSSKTPTQTCPRVEQTVDPACLSLDQPTLMDPLDYLEPPQVSRSYTFNPFHTLNAFIGIRH
jgi:hypothetical protein